MMNLVSSLLLLVLLFLRMAPVAAAAAATSWSTSFSSSVNANMPTVPSSPAVTSRESQRRRKSHTCHRSCNQIFALL